MGDDVDTLLALMGGDAPPPPRVAAASVRQKLRAGRAGPPGRQDLPEQQASELWNPTVRWNPGAAVAPAAPLRRPSAHVELARQKAVRSLQARFKAQCDALNTGWSEPEVNKNFECWMLDSSIRRPTDGGGGGGGGGGGNNDPLLPPPKTAGEDPGLRKALFASAKLQRKTAFRFCSDMQKAVSKAHRTLAQLAATGGGQNRTVRVNPATVPAAESAQQWQREHEQKQQPMLGWDGKAMLQIRYGSTSVLVNQCHWDKLATMLRLELGEEAAAEPAESGLFKERVLCLLIRYNSLQGGGVHGGGFQAAIPDRVFDSLLRHFDVCFECFASPLNSRYPHFCSAFPDTDAPFGSVGSFFNFEPREGCFEANPPFVPNLMLKMAEHMHTLLVRADGDAEDDAGEQPLCFIVIIPSWDTAMGWRALNESPFLSHHLRLGQKEHGYTEGAQHCRRSRYRISVGDTSVFFLQSKAAARKWPVSAEALADVEDSFSSKHNNDSSDSTSHETGGGGSGDEAASGDDDADSGGDVDDSGGGGSSSGRQPGGTTQEEEEEEEEEEESGQHENDEQLEDEDQGSEKGKQAKVMRKRKRAQVAASETAQQAVLGGGDGGSGGTVGAPGTAERQTKKKKEGRSKKEKREKIAQEETQKKKKKKQNKQKKKKKRRGSGIAVVTT